MLLFFALATPALHHPSCGNMESDSDVILSSAAFNLQCLLFVDFVVNKSSSTVWTVILLQQPFYIALSMEEMLAALVGRSSNLISFTVLC